MTKNEHIEYWLETAENDLDSAFDVYSVARYHWALFIGHLALEKVLKALYIQETQNVVPPKIHNLLKLAEYSSIDLTQEQARFLANVNRFQLEARYAKHKNDLFKIADKEFTENYLNKMKEYYTWFKGMIK